MSTSGFEGSIDVVVLIKAAPEIGRVHGETVCVAGIDRYGEWHRLYPVPFRDLSHSQRFGRWDIIRVRWRRPTNDTRIESKRIDPQTLGVVGGVPVKERASLVSRALARSLEDEDAAGRSLALIRPEKPRFRIKRLTTAELTKSQRRRDLLHAQSDMFAATEVPKEAPPFGFIYDFEHAGKARSYHCIDWETERSFFKFRERYGEDAALAQMKERWGSFHERGLFFAMGTHRVKHWRRWLLSGLIRAADQGQSQLQL